MRSSHQGQLVGPVVVPEESLRGITVMGHIPLIALKGMEQASDQANVVGRAATGPAAMTGQVSREDTVTTTAAGHRSEEPQPQQQNQSHPASQPQAGHRKASQRSDDQN